MLATKHAVFTKPSTKHDKKEKASYFKGTYIDERDAPMPGVP
jgi:hypothetical protein